MCDKCFRFSSRASGLLLILFLTLGGVKDTGTIVVSAFYALDDGQAQPLAVGVSAVIPNSLPPPARIAAECDVTGSVSSEGLTIGPHLLQVQVSDSLDVQGAWYPQWFEVTGPKKITGAEYFFDTDPGEGNGAAIAQPMDGTWDEPEEEIDIPALSTATLSVGLHTLWVRSIDQDGVWGRPHPSQFEVAPPGAVKVAYAEWVTDPAVTPGQRHPMTAVDGVFDSETEDIEAADIDPSLFPDCKHYTIYVRVRDSAGRWSYWWDNHWSDQPDVKKVLNRIPVATPSPDTINVPTGTTQTFCIGQDPDCDALTYAWTLDGTSVGDTSCFAYSPVAADAGTSHAVSVAVSDGIWSGPFDWTVNVQPTLTASVVGGHGTLTPATGPRDLNSAVALMATPDIGYRVKAWTGTDNDSLKTNSNTVTMTGDKTVTVQFEQIPPTTGSLTVTILPAGAVSAGAQWCVDGGAWRSSGETMSGVSVGSHVVSFKALAGWTTPGDATVNVAQGQTTPLTRSYILQTGDLKVTIEPIEARLAGAHWRVDGGTWHDSLAVESGLVIGNHMVEFRPISGWPTPDSQTAVIRLGEVTSLTATYAQPTGSLRVSIEPEAARTAGAQWRVDGGSWHAADDTVSGLTPGDHLISFKEVSGWTKPADKTVSISFGEVASATGTYTAVTGTLRVNIEPPEARSAGAQWRADGGSWHIGGESMSGLAMGSHTISFNDVAGWTRPAEQNFTIIGAATQTLTGTYLSQTGSLQVVIAPEGARAAGACWRVDDGGWQTSGQIISGLTPGEHAVDFLGVSGWTAPDSESVTVTAGQTATLNCVYTEAGGCFGSAAKRSARDFGSASGDLLLLFAAACALRVSARRRRPGPRSG